MKGNKEMEAAAREFSKTLTEKQAKAFYQLLEKTKRETGYYSRNVQANTASQEIYREGQKKYSEELEAIDSAYEKVLEEIKQEREALRLREIEAKNKAEAERSLIYDKVWTETKEARTAVWQARGDAEAEEKAIETLVIAQYQKRLDKRAKVEA